MLMWQMAIEEEKERKSIRIKSWRAQKNLLIQEYKTFRMKQGETTGDVEKIFTHIVNHLKGLGKIFEEEEINVKVMKPLNRTW